MYDLTVTLTGLSMLLTLLFVLFVSYPGASSNNNFDVAVLAFSAGVLLLFAVLSLSVGIASNGDLFGRGTLEQLLSRQLLSGSAAH